jgi:ferredoxin-nitrite reductase
MNKIEEYKREKDGLDVLEDLPLYAEEGWEAIPEGDRERLKWAGVFFRRRTPGHFMMRIRIPNGLSNSAQFHTLGGISKEFGRGFVDLTTRQQVQLRWVRIEQVPEIWRRLKAVGLTTLQTGMDNIRNVVGCPVAGLTLQELFDASAVVQQFTDTFLGNKAYTNLPRKVNITITGCKENCTHAETQDVALVPATKELAGQQVAGFNVLVGGKLGSGGYRVASSLDVFVRDEEGAEICSAIVLIFRDHGPREARNKARLAFLIDEWGVVKFRTVLEERLGRQLPRSGREERLPRTTDHIGIFRQKQPGLSYAGLCVPVGRLTADQLVEVARLAEVYGTGEIRITVGQNLILPNVRDAKLGDLTAEPLLRELRYEPAGIMRGLVSCTGIDYCNLALIETKNRALRIAQALEPKLPRNKPIAIHWSGCPAGCGNHPVADIGLLGKKARIDGEVVDAVDVFVGGSSGPEANRALPLLEDVPCDELEGVLESLARYGAFGPMRQEIRRQRSDGALHSKTPPPKPEAKYRPDLRLEEIPEGAGRAAMVDGVEVAIFRYKGQFCALENSCPHAGGSLAEGALEGEEVVCPLHGYKFNIRTGTCSTERRLRAKTFQVILEDEGFKLEPG